MQQGISSRKALPLLERDTELELVRAAFDTVQSGSGVLVQVSGEAGIGKTTFMRAIARSVPESWLSHWGYCENLSTARPLSPLFDIAPFLGSDLWDLLETSSDTSKIFTVAMDALRRRKSPSVLLFEDMHWADNASFDLVRFLGRRLAGLPIMWVVSFRDDECPEGHPLRKALAEIPSSDVIRIALKPMSANAVETLATSMGKSAGDVHALTGGNPFFVSELLANETESALPQTVREAVLGRTQRVSPAADYLLRVASLVPGRVGVTLLQSLFDQSIDSALNECVALGLFERNTDKLTIQFRHEIARQSIEAMVPNLQREQIHLTYLRSIFSSDPSAYARQMYHAEKANAALEVLEIAPRAAAQAARLGAHREAAQHLKKALQYSDRASPAERAHLYEQWSYEASITTGIDQSVIDARHTALAIRRELGHLPEIGINLRWLSRLQWYQGRSDLSNLYAEEAIRTLEGCGAPKELAMAYSVRSQFYMLSGNTEQAVLWGERALTLAATVNDIETTVHALCNIGTAEINAGEPGGRAKMDRSLALALEHCFHEHAARVYTNLGVYLVVSKQFALADVYIAEGVAFDESLDLDSWTFYLMGWLAQLRLDQGRYQEAIDIAEGVIARKNLSPLMHLPSLSVLGTALIRLGVEPGVSKGVRILKDGFAFAQPMKEPNRVIPLGLALCEAAWYAGNDIDAQGWLAKTRNEMHQYDNQWYRGAIQLWARRLNEPYQKDVAPNAPPFQAELLAQTEEHHLACSRNWANLGAPLEAALALSEAGAKHINDAIFQLENIGALAAAGRVRQQARAAGLEGLRRGPYKASKDHQLGLTAKEQEILAFLVDGLTNQEIGQKISRSTRTVEHHVASLLQKIGAKNRTQAVQKAALLLQPSRDESNNLQGSAKNR